MTGHNNSISFNYHVPDYNTNVPYESIATHTMFERFTSFSRNVGSIKVSISTTNSTNVSNGESSVVTTLAISGRGFNHSLSTDGSNVISVGPEQIKLGINSSGNFVLTSSTSVPGTAGTISVGSKLELHTTSALANFGMWLENTLFGRGFIGFDSYLEETLSQGLNPFTAEQQCFLAATSIDLWPLDADIKKCPDGIYDQVEVRAKTFQKPIEDVSVGDVVVAPDKNGNLMPGDVTRTFKNHVKRILDFWGTGVTPGHVYLCGDGKFKGQDVPLLDILRSDGAIINRDGTLIRAATSAPVGSKYDQFVSVVTGDLRLDGTVDVKESGRIRAGTHYIDSDGQTRILMSALLSNNGVLHEDGTVSKDIFSASGKPFHWTLTDSIPKPEDYILQRSNLTLAQIYAVGEWEQVKPQMPAPATDTAIGQTTVAAAGVALQSLEPQANIPPAFANRPDAPTTTALKSARPSMSRKQRKAMEAKARTRPKARVHS